MYKISVENLKPNMLVARNIYTPDGLLLLKKGAPLTPNYIHRLHNANIHSIYVTSANPNLEVKLPPPLVTEETHRMAVKKLYNAVKKYKFSNQLHVAPLKQVILPLIQELLANQHILYQTADIRSHDDCTFTHSINVCVLSTMVGHAFGYRPEQLRSLALGALLHDIGKTPIPLSVLNKPGPLTPDEMTLVKTHARLGFEILRTTPDFTFIPLQIALQHHERFDGSGYPQGLQGEEIYEYARIVAIADVYDALTSDRPYKKAYTPDIAHRIMTKKSPGHFDPLFLKLFFDHVALYPVGTIVKLTFGYYAVVTEVHSNATNRPMLRLVADERQKPLKHPALINLKNSSDHIIESVASEQEVLALIRAPRGCSFT